MSSPHATPDKSLVRRIVKRLFSSEKEVRLTFEERVLAKVSELRFGIVTGMAGTGKGVLLQRLADRLPGFLNVTTLYLKSVPDEAVSGFHEAPWTISIEDGFRAYDMDLQSFLSERPLVKGELHVPYGHLGSPSTRKSFIEHLRAALYCGTASPSKHVVVLVDCLNAFDAKDIETLVAQARKYGVKFIIEMDSLQDSPSLLANCTHLFVFKLPAWSELPQWAEKAYFNSRDFSPGEFAVIDTIRLDEKAGAPLRGRLELAIPSRTT